MMETVLLIGDGGVGKTSYIHKQLRLKVNGQYHPTYDIQIYEDHNNNTRWVDFPGQEKYAPHTINIPINKVIYMYDVTNNISFKNISFWKNYVKKHYGDNIPSVDFGNKVDLLR